MSKLLYPDIAAVTALFTTDTIDIEHADNGEIPGTGTIRGIFPEGYWKHSINRFTSEAAALGIAVTGEDIDGETAILSLDWRSGISRDRALEIIVEEEMDVGSLGCVECLTISDAGMLRDDSEEEAADLTSEDAFRAQVVAWGEAISA